MQLETSRIGMGAPSIWKTLVIFLALSFAALPGSAQDIVRSTCTPTSLQNATTAYDFGRFSRAFVLLRPCLPDGFSSKTQRTSAWRVLALSYMAVDSLDLARESVRGLLKVDSGYRPDPAVEPPTFVDLVNDLKPRWYTWPWKGGQWYRWVGRGLIVGAAVGLPMLLKNEALPELPLPPGSPGG